jgi:hypothetical protein
LITTGLFKEVGQAVFGVVLVGGAPVLGHIPGGIVAKANQAVLDVGSLVEELPYGLAAMSTHLVEIPPGVVLEGVAPSVGKWE